MITELQGFKGSTRKYTAPVSESAFSGDQLQFFSIVELKSHKCNMYCTTRLKAELNCFIKNPI